MTVFSSCSQQCFLDDAISLLPEDAHALSTEEHQAYLAGQIAGKVIDFSTCPPSLVDQPPTPPEQLAEVERDWRNSQLAETDGLVARHRDELEETIATTLTPDQYGILQVYRRELRTWPESTSFPDKEFRPVQPIWINQNDTP